MDTSSRATARPSRTGLAGLLVGLALLTACTGGDTGVGSSVAPASDEEPAATGTDVIETDASGSPPPPEEFEHVDRPIPADLDSAVDLAVESGNWSEPEAVALALAGALGLDDAPPGLSLDGVTTGELTGLVRRAEGLIDSDGISPADAEPLMDLLWHVRPTQAVLDRISEPPQAIARSDIEGGEESASASPPERRSSFQLVAARSQAPGDLCGTVASQGFDPASIGVDEAATDGPRCYGVLEDLSTGHRLAVYYPVDWRADPTVQDLPGEALDALVTAANRYATIPGLAPTGAVNLVFSLFDAPLLGGHAFINASTGYIRPERTAPTSPCPVTIFPTGIGRSVPEFKRTVAHEIIHCIAERMESTWVHDKWWIEGAAEYLSNVVYPSVNDEHKFDRQFSILTNRYDHALPALKYANVVFFQFYANQHGDEGLVRLLQSLLGQADPIAVLSNTGGMDDDWEEFLVRYAAGAIADTDPNGPSYGVTVRATPELIGGREEVFLAAEPFVPVIYPFLYTSTSAQFGHQIAGDVRVSTAPLGPHLSPARWLRSSSGSFDHCGSWRYYVIPAVFGTETATITIDEVEEGACATCPVQSADASTAFQVSMDFAELPAGAPEGLDPRGFSTHGVKLACQLVELATFPECGGRGQAEICEKEVSTLRVAAITEAPGEFFARAQISPDRVDDFAEPAIYVNNGQGQRVSSFWGGEQFGDNLQELAVVIEDVVNAISVEGLVVYERGQDATYEAMKLLVDAIELRLAEDPELYDDFEAESDDDGGSGPAPDDPTPDATQDDGTGATGGSGGAPEDAGVATASVDGVELRFEAVLICSISESAIDAHIAADTAGTAGGSIKASGESGLVSIQAQSLLEGRMGYRMRLDLPDPNLDVGSGTFTLSGPATAHDDVRDLGDPGTPAGEATVSMSC
jgi:hypothetical protein